MISIVLKTENKTQKNDKKTNLVVFFKILQIHKTSINPYYDKIENTFEKNAKITKKTTKNLHDQDRIQNPRNSLPSEEAKLRLKDSLLQKHILTIECL